MPILPNYTEFAGRHHETGTVRNALAYQGVKAPHTDEAISEALLLGISGGIAFGYFTFEYTGYMPHIALLTRNTFSPLETLFDRFPLPHEVMQTAKLGKGAQNLLEVLEGGRPAIVWADIFTLPHYDLPEDENNWAMMPVLVYGVDGSTVYLADRANAPITIDLEVFNQARARVKKDKFKVITFDAPNMDKLPLAVNKGIWQCINLFTEAPPKGKRDNFGFAALQYWAKMLTNTRNKSSWSRYFGTIERLWMALVGDQVQAGAFGWIHQGAGNSAERGMYADFLDESAMILNKPDLKSVADMFRQSEGEWTTLSEMLLPDDNSVLRQAKALLKRRREVFINNGSDGLTEIQSINQELNTLRADAPDSLGMSESDLIAFREQLATQVLKIHDVELEAITCLQSVMT